MMDASGSSGGGNGSSNRKNNNNDDRKRAMSMGVPYEGPQIQPIRFTQEIFPSSAAVKNATGLPLSCTITPNVKVRASRSNSDRDIPIDQIARCRHCFGYINPFCAITRRWWQCALCGEQTPVSAMPPRYASSTSSWARSALPELAHQLVEFALPLDSKEAQLHHGKSMLQDGYLVKEAAEHRPLVYLAVVDELGGSECVDAIVITLQTLLEELPDDCRFGLLTVSDRIGMFDMTAIPPSSISTSTATPTSSSAPTAHVHFVDISAEAKVKVVEGGAFGISSEVPLVLSDVLELDELACSVGDCRHNIAQAIAALPEVCCSASGRGTGSAGAYQGDRDNCLGTNLRLILDLVLEDREAAAEAAGEGGVAGKPGGVAGMGFVGGRGLNFAAVHMLIFLGTRPNCGPGAIPVASDVDKDAAAAGPPQPNQTTTDQHNTKRSSWPSLPLPLPSLSSSSSSSVSAAAWSDSVRGDREASEYYRKQATRAATNGVCIAIHAIDPGATKLDYLASADVFSRSGNLSAVTPSKHTPAFRPPSFVAVTPSPPLPPPTPAAASSSSTSSMSFGLASLKPVTQLTGGTLARHSLSHSQPGERKAEMVAKAIVRETLMPRAWDTLLKVRTSSGLAVKSDCVYGIGLPDAQFESVWHISGCGSWQSLAMDLEFTGQDITADAEDEGGVVVQVAFAYTALLPVEPGEGEEGGQADKQTDDHTNNDDDDDDDDDDGDQSPTPRAPTLSTSTSTSNTTSTSTVGRGSQRRRKSVVVRRLRVFTVVFEASSDVGDCLSSACPAPIMAIIMHKVMAEALKSNFIEARTLLRDWLLNALDCASKHLVVVDGDDSGGGGGHKPGGRRTPRGAAWHTAKKGGTGSTTDRYTYEELLELTDYGKLVRYVYGLLMGPLLLPGPSTSSSFSDDSGSGGPAIWGAGNVVDCHITFWSTLACLDPGLFVLTLYPEMQGFFDVNTRLSNHLRLCRESTAEGMTVRQPPPPSPAGSSSLSNTQRPPPLAMHSRIFVVDNYFRVVVYYSTPQSRGGASHVGQHDGLPYPPPVDSGLGRFLAGRARREAPCLLDVVTCRSGETNCYFFEEMLIEDRPLPSLKISASTTTSVDNNSNNSNGAGGANEVVALGEIETGLNADNYKSFARLLLADLN